MGQFELDLNTLCVRGNGVGCVETYLPKQPGPCLLRDLPGMPEGVPSKWGGVYWDLIPWHVVPAPACQAPGSAEREGNCGAMQPHVVGIFLRIPLGGCKGTNPDHGSGCMMGWTAGRQPQHNTSTDRSTTAVCPCH